MQSLPLQLRKKSV